MSVVIFFKEKGYIMHCVTHTGLKMLKHSLKIMQKVVE